MLLFHTTDCTQAHYYCAGKCQMKLHRRQLGRFAKRPPFCSSCWAAFVLLPVFLPRAPLCTAADVLLSCRKTGSSKRGHKPDTSLKSYRENISNLCSYISDINTEKAQQSKQRGWHVAPSNYWANNDCWKHCVVKTHQHSSLLQNLFNFDNWKALVSVSYLLISPDFLPLSLNSSWTL